MSEPVIDSVNQLTPKAFMELVAKLEPFFAQIKQKGMGGAGIRFITDPQLGAWLVVQTNDSHEGDFGEWGMLFEEENSAGILLVSRDAGNTKTGEAFVLPDGVSLTLSGGGASPSLTLSRSTDQTRLVGQVEFALTTAGKTFTIKDASNNPIVQYTG